MLSETVKQRLSKDRAMTSITLRIPVDVVQSLRAIAPHRGFTGYQTLLKAYLSEGLRRDEALLSGDASERLLRALRKRGVPAQVLAAARRDALGDE